MSADDRRPDDAGFRARAVKICTGSACVAAGAQEIAEAFRTALARAGGDPPAVDAGPREDRVRATGCFGPCGIGPLVEIPELDLLYCRVRLADVEEIVETTMRRGRTLRRLLYRDGATGRTRRGAWEIPFFTLQTRRVLERCGEIDPERIDDYVERGGYRGLERAVRRLTPAEIVEEIKRSGLQGRGGAGFPAGLKWSLVAGAEADDRVVICNADEGDPGAFTDRGILEGDPHAVIEGLAIAGRAVDAATGLVYVRSEYPLAIRRMELGLEQARRAGYLGPDVLGSGFSFEVSIVPGAGAYVCGEETALIHSIEGRRAMPRPRPPYPARRGLWGGPTLIHNVETFANVTRILANGAGEFSRVGTALSRGTKTLALTGRISNPGLIEVPLGITPREIVDEIGGGIPGGGRFKAALLGGPGGGWLSAEDLDTPIDFPSLTRLGLTMGSGGLMLLDERTCIVRVVRQLMEFFVEESCGKCPPCRIGTRTMLNLLDRASRGESPDGELERLRTLGDHIRRTSLCGLGRQAPNPTLSGMRKFRGEFEAHILHHRCPAGECPGLAAGEAR